MNGQIYVDNVVELFQIGLRRQKRKCEPAITRKKRETKNNDNKL